MNLEDKNKILKRKQMRNSLLFELYNYYHENKGRSLVLKLKDISDEQQLAYKYLEDKALLFLDKVDEDTIMLQLTLTGIDYVEDLQNNY